MLFARFENGTNDQVKKKFPKVKFRKNMNKRKYAHGYIENF